ncbi:hypothetical protein EDB83DRAFT_2420861 [Lactarius deliciosus]|nr:hypothetical protein EDB83DRAFT_2420861 [Lactarius deliciosus]
MYFIGDNPLALANCSFTSVFHPSAFPASSSFVFLISFFILFAAAKHTQAVNQHQLRRQMKSGNRADASDEGVYEGVRCGRCSHMRPCTVISRVSATLRYPSTHSPCSAPSNYFPLAKQFTTLASRVFRGGRLRNLIKLIARGNLRNQNFGGPTVTFMTASNFQCHRVSKCSQLYISSSF